MGVECGLAGVAQATFVWLVQNPGRVVDFVDCLCFGQPPAETLQQLKALPGSPRSLVESLEYQQTEKAKARQRLLSEFTEIDQDLDRPTLDLQHHWILLESVLRQIDSDRGDLLHRSAALIGGQQLGPQLGFGRAQFVDPKSTGKIARSLRATSAEEVSRAARETVRLAAEDGQAPTAEELEILRGLVSDLCEFYESATENQFAVAIILR